MWELSLPDAIEEVTEGPLLFYGEASAVEVFRVSGEAPNPKTWASFLCIDLRLRLMTGEHGRQEHRVSASASPARLIAAFRFV
jgi:hypothetical protein